MDDAVGQPTLSDGPIVGTGPYRFQQRTQGSFVRFELSSGEHWRLSPDFPELELRWSSEASTRLAALLAGEVHLTTIIPDQEAQAKDEGMKLAKGNVPGFRTFFNFQGSWWNTHGDPESGRKFPDSPLLDQKVRQALSKAINRDALNTAFFGGEADIMVNNHFHQPRLGWNPSWQTRFPAQYGLAPAAPMGQAPWWVFGSCAIPDGRVGSQPLVWFGWYDIVLMRWRRAVRRPWGFTHWMRNNERSVENRHSQ